jgi:hypothetical protein
MDRLCPLFVKLGERYRPGPWRDGQRAYRCSATPLMVGTPSYSRRIAVNRQGPRRSPPSLAVVEHGAHPAVPVRAMRCAAGGRRSPRAALVSTTHGLRPLAVRPPSVVGATRTRHNGERDGVRRPPQISLDQRCRPLSQASAPGSCATQSGAAWTCNRPVRPLQAAPHQQGTGPPRRPAHAAHLLSTAPWCHEYLPATPPSTKRPRLRTLPGAPRDDAAR